MFLDPNLLAAKARHAIILARAGKKEDAIILARRIVAENPGFYDTETVGWGSRPGIRQLLQ